MAKDLVEKLGLLAYRMEEVNRWVTELREERLRSLGSIEVLIEEILDQVKTINKQEKFIEDTVKDVLLEEQRNSESILAKCPSLANRILTDIEHRGLAMAEAHELLNLRIQQIEGGK